MPILKRVRVIKKIQEGGAWRFVSLKRSGKRYGWDPRPGSYYLEWWDGGRRLREVAGDTPSQAIAAQRRKQLGLGGTQEESAAKLQAEEERRSSTPISDANEIFRAHIRAHSPDKPETVRRYRQVPDHFERLIGHRITVEAITRADIDDYKIRRQQEQSLRHKRLITPPTINFEVSTLRTFFYYLINERGVKTENPCARFKHLRDAKNKAGRRPPTYTQAQLDALFTYTDIFEKALFATLLLTGLRKRELYFLSWRDVDLTTANLRVSGEGKTGLKVRQFSRAPTCREDRSALPELIMSTSPAPTVSETGCCADVFDQLAQCQRMLTAKELANILAISPKTIYGYVERNMIPHYKIEASVRFRARDVVEWLRRHSCTRSDTVAQTLRSAPGSRMRKSA